MTNHDFRKYAHQLVDWMADYFENIEKYPVKSQVKPGETIHQLPVAPPQSGEDFSEIFKDFQDTILPGITHWQHPNFHAYFTANNSYPSVLGEMLMSTLGAQCMSWVTSPSATELEERVMDWLKDMLGLPAGFSGVIEDTASTATLCSILTAREVKTQYQINQKGFYQQKPFTIYCSQEAHSSVEKGVKIAGIGKHYLRKIAVDDQYAMKPEALQKTIEEDIAEGTQPLAVIVAIGTTGSTAVDPLNEIGKICEKHQIWLHVDAAYAGTAFLLPEMRHHLKGIEYADSFVFNPHKWMFTNFDCSAYFVKEKEYLIKTFEILPEYLKTKENQVNNYRDWGIQLGRRFRALKLWFVLRSFGVKGLQKKIKEHIDWAQKATEILDSQQDFEILAPTHFSTICFRFKPAHLGDQAEINQINARIMEKINQSGKIYLSHTKLKGNYTIRLVIGQTNSTWQHV
ncbi:MAG: pyridoxal-dependent decarboxylase, partial [Spirochaetes bacterium]|nr:pyridoxal-dependent decarboxylase [Spirochaetota bacterium]